MNERNVFPSGCIYIRVQGVTTHNAFLVCIKNAILLGPAQLADRFKHMLSSPQFSSLSNDSEDHLRELEEFITNFLAPLKLLLVIDHVDDILLTTNVDEITDLRMFFSHLFERCRNLKILITSTQLIGIFLFLVRFSFLTY